MGETMFNYLQSKPTDYLSNLYPGCAGIPPANGADPNSLNCVVQVCPHNAGASILGADAVSTYNTIRSNCATKAGGDERLKDDWFDIPPISKIFANPFTLRSVGICV